MGGFYRRAHENAAPVCLASLLVLSDEGQFREVVLIDRDRLHVDDQRRL